MKEFDVPVFLRTPWGDVDGFDLRFPQNPVFNLRNNFPDKPISIID
jgi:hypothetical protein